MVSIGSPRHTIDLYSSIENVLRELNTETVVCFDASNLEIVSGDLV